MMQLRPPSMALYCLVPATSAKTIILLKFLNVSDFKVSKAFDILQKVAEGL